MNAASGANLAREYQKGFQPKTGRATCISKEYTSPKAPIGKGTFCPFVETPRRSPHLAAKRKATEQHVDGSQAVGTSEEGPSLIHTLHYP